MVNLSHFEALLLYALPISVAFALLTKNTARERIKSAVTTFLLFVLVAVALGWIMYPFSR